MKVLRSRVLAHFTEARRDASRSFLSTDCAGKFLATFLTVLWLTVPKAVPSVYYQMLYIYFVITEGVLENPKNPPKYATPPPPQGPGEEASRCILHSTVPPIKATKQIKIQHNLT